MKETLHVIREGKSDPRLYFCPEEEASSALSLRRSLLLLFLLVASLSLSLDFLRSRQLPPAFLLNTQRRTLLPLPPSPFPPPPDDISVSFPLSSAFSLSTGEAV